MEAFLFFSKWQSNNPVAPAAVDTTTFYPYLTFKISNPLNAANPLFIR